MFHIDPETVKFQPIENVQPEKIRPMPLEIMKLLGIARDIKKEETKAEETAQ